MNKLPLSVKIKDFLDKYLTSIVIIVELIVVISCIYFITYPLYKSIRILRDDIEIQQAKLVGLTEYANYLEELASSSLAVEKDLVDYALPSENDIITLLVTYQGLGTVEGVTIEPISIEPGDLKKTVVEDETTESIFGLQQIPFKLTATAKDRISAEALIKEIANTRRLFDIESLDWTVSSESKTTDEEQKLIFSLVSYYYLNSPNDKGSRQLVQTGKMQTDFINSLNNSKVYETVILEDVEVGKVDLFKEENNPNAKIIKPTTLPLKPSPIATKSAE